VLGQLEAIIADGIAAGDFAGTDVAIAARAVFEATAAFHNPAHVGEWLRTDRDEFVRRGLPPHRQWLALGRTFVSRP
jgi:hypothetical protein